MYVKFWDFFYFKLLKKTKIEVINFYAKLSTMYKIINKILIKITLALY